MIEIEVQNETYQSQTLMRFAAVPRIGEGLRLREPDGIWASYDVIDVWYQKAEFGDVWVPYLHVRMTPSEVPDENSTSDYVDDFDVGGDEDSEESVDEGMFASLVGEAEPFKI